MTKLKNLLMAKAKQINENKMLVKEVRDWISGYAGKIIAIRTPEEAYHLVFTDGGVAVKEGDYPSCQAYYRGPEEEIIKVLESQNSAYTGYPAGKFHFWGSLSEGQKFERLTQMLRK